MLMAHPTREQRTARQTRNPIVSAAPSEMVREVRVWRVFWTPEKKLGGERRRV